MVVMTFSNEIRQELCNIKINTKKEMIFFLNSVLLFSGDISLLEEKIETFSISVNNKDVAKKIAIIFKKIFRITLEINQKNNYNFGRDFLYNLQFPEEHKSALNNIFEELLIIQIYGDLFSFKNDNIVEEILNSEDEGKIFLRGVYMVCGSLTNPEKNYHLEFTTHNKSLASSLSSFLNSYEIKSHIVERKDLFVIYVKDSDSISDFLNIIGAHDSMFKFEDIRVKKNLRNNVNRIVNCETANLLKITKGYIKHKKAIEYIINKRSIDYIPEDLRELALLRLSNECYSLKDLGEKLSVPLSKSGVNYRLKKIEDIAMNLYKEEEGK
jgi:hypothetical protein